MTDRPLTPMGRAALLWLDGDGGVVEPGLAYRLGQHLREQGFPTRGNRDYDSPARTAGRVLSYLAGRGLVENDGGGCFLSNFWEITDDGTEEARRLRAGRA